MTKATVYRMVWAGWGLLAALGVVGAQPTDTPRQFNESEWQALHHDLDYAETPTARVTPSAPGRTSTPDTDNPTLWRILFFVALALGLGWLVWRIARRPVQRRPQNKATAMPDSPLDELEQNLLQSDLTGALRQAEDSGHYGLAVRVHYLMTLQVLHQARRIVWSRHKTNYDYRLEMAGKPHEDDFRQLTLAFERSWYGNHPPSAAHYAELRGRFEAFTQALGAATAPAA